MNSKLENIVIAEDRNVYDVLELIDKNAKGVVFVVDKDNKICGVITDGDIRRGLLNNITINDKLTTVMNRSFVAVQENTSFDEVMERIGYKYKSIPIVNSEGEIVDYYSLDLDCNIPISKPLFIGNELKYVTECIATNWISSKGKFVNMFESKFAEYIGSEYAAATSNGTTALHLALEALGIKAGDEVIVPALTFIATANAVTYTGAKPVFADSEMDTWNIDPKSIEAKITDKTKAIIPVHIYGQPAKMDEIMEIAKRNNLYVVEDAAEAHGAEYKGKKVGGIGHIGVFSFYGNKIITSGEGGMLVTNDAEIFRKSKILRDHGMNPEKKYWHDYIGFNYRMTNLQAAVGCAQLENIDYFLKKKQDIVETYKQCLSGVQKITPPPENSWSINVSWLYSVVFKGKSGAKSIRDRIIERLEEGNIECRPFFYPIHKLPPYFSEEILETAEYLSANGINMPSYIDIETDNVKKVCNKLKELLDEC